MQQIIKDFFLAIQGGNDSFKSFLGTWSALYESVIANPHSLEEETIQALHNSASVISIGASDILQLQIDSERIGNEAVADVTKILDAEMGKLWIDDKQQNSRYSKASIGPSSTPAYVQPAYTWLLSNLHNPYPSKEVKKNISNQTHSLVKDIDAWFIDARKRIGWNKLRKTKFSNKQENIIAAATHFFKPKPTSFNDDPGATLLSEMDPNDVYRSDFAAIQSDAKRLYANKFPELVSQQAFDFVAPTKTQKKQRRDNHSTTPFPQATTNNTSLSYPSPEPSPPSYLSEELSPSSPVIPLLENIQTKSRKRRQSSSDISDSEDILACPPKRFRSDTNNLTDTYAVANLPSPSNTIDLSEDTSEDSFSSLSSSMASSALTGVLPPFDSLNDTGDDNSSLLQFVPALPIASDTVNLKRKRRLSDGERREPAKHSHFSRTSEVTITKAPVISGSSRLKRKRRLSDGESQCTPKRPHHALALPRLQTASNPLPMVKPYIEDHTDTWCQDDAVSECEFNIPLSASSGDFSLIAPSEFYHGQNNLPGTYPNLSPQESIYFVTEESSALEPSFERPKTCSDFLASPFHLDTLQNSVFDVVVGNATLSDFDDLITTPVYNLPLPTQHTPFKDDSQQSPSISEWMAYLQSDISYTSLETLNVETADLNYIFPQSLSETDPLDAKRAELHALKEKVRQLEAEL